MIQKYEKYLYCFELKNAFLNQKKFEIFLIFLADNDKSNLNLFK